MLSFCNQTVKSLAIVIGMGMPLTQALAQDTVTCNTLFGAAVSAGQTTAQICSTSLQSLYESGIRDVGNLFPSYTGAEAVTTNARLNGLASVASFEAGSASLHFVMPALGINETFAGATRVDSARMLHDWLKNNSDLLGQMLRYQASNSPTNPMTGPGGLLTNAVGSDFDSSFSEVATRIATSLPNAQGASASQIGIGMLISESSVAGMTVRTLSIPLSYTVRNDIDPRRQALLRGGIGVVDEAGSRAYNARVSAGYRFPMSDDWVLTPMAGVSVAGSQDAGYFTGVFNGSVASTYLFEQAGFDVTIGNLVGYYKTFKPSGSGTAMDPGIGQLTLRNGIMLSQPVLMFGSKMSAEYGLSDTRYLNSTLYQQNGQDLSISLGTNKNAFSARSFFRATLLLQRARDSHGVALNVNYWF
jgi:hypothetical protein